MKVVSKEGLRQLRLKRITTINGEVIEFEPLVYKESNLIKVTLSYDGFNTEGIWAVVSDKDLEDIKNHKSTGYFICMLVNNAICFYPNNSWGLHVVAKFNGDARPISYRNWVNYSRYENRIWSEESNNK